MCSYRVDVRIQFIRQQYYWTLLKHYKETFTFYWQQRHELTGKMLNETIDDHRSTSTNWQLTTE